MYRPARCPAIHTRPRMRYATKPFSWVIKVGKKSRRGPKICRITAVVARAAVIDIRTAPMREIRLYGIGGYAPVESTGGCRKENGNWAYATFCPGQSSDHVYRRPICGACAIWH